MHEQDIFWSDGGDLVAITSESSFYILKFNVGQGSGGTDAQLTLLTVPWVKLDMSEDN